jgi:signal transduction histidine kinase
MLAESCLRTVESEGSTLTIEEDRAALADPTRLRQHLQNLFENAVNHGGDGVKVTNGRLERGFYNADDGRGLSDAAHERLSELGVSGATNGAGSGLSIVKCIVEAHGWKISVTTVAESGARVGVTGVEFA